MMFVVSGDPLRHCTSAVWVLVSDTLLIAACCCRDTMVIPPK